MNRNGRRIALSMVAIVLGAGYLMKIIPPETDIGLSDSHSISIDGALVTNPLDLGESPHLSSPSVSPVFPDSKVQTAPTQQPNGKATGVSGGLDPTPLFPFVNNGGSPTHPSMPSEAAGPGTDVPAEFNAPPTPTPIGEVAVNSSAPGNGWSPSSSGSNPSPGTPPPQVPDPNLDGDPVPFPPPGSGAVELPDTPDIDLPSDPQGPGPIRPEVEDPKFTDSLPDPWTPPEAPVGTDLPTHHVPESGMMVTMLGFTLILLAAFRKRLEGVQAP